MPVTYFKFKHCQQLQKASTNSPPLKRGTVGEGVRLVQDAFHTLGYALPASTLPSGGFDGIYGGETKEVVAAFQRTHLLKDDGQVGELTLAKLESELTKPAPAPPPKLEDFLPHTVPGRVRRILQSELLHPSNLTRNTDWLCWAAAVTTMQSWRDRTDYAALDVIKGLGEFYETRFEFGRGIPWPAYGMLLDRAGMKALPPQTVPTPMEWYELLRDHGLLWVGASEGGPDYTHSYIVRGMYVFPGHGVRMQMTQPGSIRDWDLSVTEFTDKVKEAGKPGYFQVRYYPNRGR